MYIKHIIKFMLLCMLFSCILAGCTFNNEPIEETTTASEITINRYDCFEYDIPNLKFTNNILCTISLPSTYTETEQSQLLYDKTRYYIGEFKNQTEQKTISLYELYDENYTDDNKVLVTDNWKIENDILETTNSIFYFYKTNNTKYPIVLSIQYPNNVDVTEAINELSNIVNESYNIPEKQETMYVEGTLDKPAEIGEWVSTYKYNPTSDKYEPVSICITDIYRGNDAYNVVKAYNDTLDVRNEPQKVINYPNNGSEFVVYEYAIYFPTSYTENEDGILNVNIPTTICNLNDFGYINGDTTNQLTETFNISKVPDNLHNGCIFTGGVGIFRMNVNFDDYLIKIVPDNNTEPKYYKGK